MPTKILRLDSRSANIPPSRSKSDSREGSRCETFSFVRLSYQTRGLKKLQVNSRLRYWHPEGDVFSYGYGLSVWLRAGAEIRANIVGMSAGRIPGC